LSLQCAQTYFSPFRHLLKKASGKKKSQAFSNDKLTFSYIALISRVSKLD